MSSIVWHEGGSLWVVRHDGGSLWVLRHEGVSLWVLRHEGGSLWVLRHEGSSLWVLRYEGGSLLVLRLRPTNRTVIACTETGVKCPLFLISIKFTWRIWAILIVISNKKIYKINLRTLRSFLTYILKHYK